MIPVNFIKGGDYGLNTILYKQPDQSMINYMQMNMQDIYNRAGALSSQFIDTVRTMYNKAYSDEAIQAAKVYLASTNYAINPDAIYSVGYESLTTANPVMQQYIMAYPELSIKYPKNQCDGFSDTYFNQEPETVGEERYDYQRVMDGVLQHDNEGQAYIKYYGNADDIELYTVEKLSILDTWNNVARWIAEGRDPTDISEGEL